MAKSIFKMNEAKSRIEVTSDTYFEFHIILEIVIFQLKVLFAFIYFVFIFVFRN
jgi:hypothetical protein